MRRIAVLVLFCGLTACSSQPAKNEYDSLSAAQIYAKGRHYLKRQQYVHAMEEFDALEARFPYGEFAERAQLAGIYAYYESQEPELALAAADRFIQLHPRHEQVQYAYYMKGLVKFSESLVSFDRYLPLNPADRDITGAREAFFHFDELLRRFPNSLYAEDARQRMVFLKVVLAEHHIQVAQHYLTRQAYVAALDRATQVIEQFSDTPARKEALKIMVTCYTAIKLTQLAQDTERVLKNNL
jgi:outer membrane protein assembly factor BamD